MKHTSPHFKTHQYKAKIDELKNKCKALEKELNRKDKALSAYSNPNRAVIPIQTGQRFQSKPGIYQENFIKIKGGLFEGIFDQYIKISSIM